MSSSLIGFVGDHSCVGMLGVFDESSLPCSVSSNVRDEHLNSPTSSDSGLFASVIAESFLLHKLEQLLDR